MYYTYTNTSYGEIPLTYIYKGNDTGRNYIIPSNSSSTLG
jgi:hypothetical protein